VLHVLDVLVAQEAGLVRRAQHPRPHPISDHDFVLLLGDSLQGLPKVSDYQHRVGLIRTSAERKVYKLFSGLT
jgi:hypothetical protein